MTNTRCTVCGSATDAYLCATPCGDELAKTLGDLPGLLDALVDRAAGNTRIYRASRLIPWQDDELAGLEDEHAKWIESLPIMTRGRDGRITLPATQLPVDLDATRLLGEARNALTTWARLLAETHGVEALAPTPAVVVTDVHVSVMRNRWRIVREPRIVTEARSLPLEDVVRWLHQRVSSIRYDEAAREIFTQLTALAGKITRAVDRSPADTYAGPCAHCGVDMWRRAGADQIVCDARYYVLDDEGQLATVRGCGAIYTLRERTTWLLDAIRDELAPLDMLQGFVHSMGWPWPPPATVRGWRFRRRLDVRSVDRHGVELFRGGDVLDLLEEWAASRSDARAG